MSGGLLDALLLGGGLSGALHDPDTEETYCVCGRVSFGEMVCCDNPSCAREWFHFGCVGLEETPVGTWLCPVCTLLQNAGLELPFGHAGGQTA